LRRSIGVVPQDTILFNESIRYNISYSNPNATLEQVQEAVQRAKISDFINKSQNGFKTIVGERGLRLSGGEKQRVSIARTFLKNPPILLLDEATSALDSKTEHEIQASLYELTKGVTTVVIAHRLSTIVDAEQILFIKGGKITERGSHAQLLALNGEYKLLWDTQMNRKI